ncbi:PIN domain-containing protein [Algoriphagus sp. C2-6-M1]|uniref:PIN domain-containing protein n=1 Tax=Algoriphagus persicinus TaxID=3108754 RepID=UPI002B3A5531|nr:PIN domain-containing protein [Algoriphagus sp. C2-6-M1]MEB2782576.1 PIN domain-containing protein [Algoriphagus sp. C2-6-M1]
MKSFAKNITEKLKQLELKYSVFLSNHSKIKRIVFPNDGIFSGRGDYSYEGLKNEAISIQDRLYKDFCKVFEIIEVLISDSSKEHIRAFKSNKTFIENSLLQNDMTFYKSIEEVEENGVKAIEDIIELILSLYPKTIVKPILVVDTNSLYQKHEIEDWTFDDFNEFEIIITPSVLKDLDKHKVEHRNEEIRKKAIKIIKKLKEYRRRGKLIEGVTIIKGKITLRTIAVEANFDKTLKWLDSKNDDDRLIAEFLEIMKNLGNASVHLVTSDINLQNKCEAADLSFIEPPL